MEDLVAAARDAVADAHAPYSEYRVGAALEAADGTVYTGCNVEIANYTNTLHAEEVALGRAVADGRRAFERLAVSSAARDAVTPCGMCRQSLAEFCEDDLRIGCDAGTTVEVHDLATLLPAAMGAETLGVDG